MVVGENGSGKTSLLEAVAYCSTLKSFRGAPREAVVRGGLPGALLECELSSGSRYVEVKIEIEPGRHDRAWLNSRRVESSGQLLDVLRTTLFSPDDLDIVKGPPSVRRGLLDDAIESTSRRGAAERGELERVLRHRNALLRQLHGRLDKTTALSLEVWDERLVASGEALVARREELVGELGPLAAEAFRSITGGGDLSLVYERSFGDSLAVAIDSARAEDLRRQMTTVGPHRDDLYLSLGNLDARTRLSQGRQRCVALAIRLATHRRVSLRTGTAPVLLLDDAFSELDQTTASHLFRALPPGQTLVTTAGALPPGASPDALLRLVDGCVQ